jgi:integrase/recombinase XerD
VLLLRESNTLEPGPPPHLVQRWLGHASLRTTAIYGDVTGPDERVFGERMWVGKPKPVGTAKHLG